jgi:energy-coupling factor transporter ATP-binding protein EcfA2
MRLLSLTVSNFRGFGTGSPTIPLAGDLVLLFGPNGFGKTSLAEAIEWLLYGTTRRRQRGDSYSKNEFEGCFPNAHGGAPVEVSARVRLPGGTEHTIARSIPDPRHDTVSLTFINGRQEAFDAIGLSKIEALHPVVAQHDLQSFIHSRPKERRDFISAALGLEEITALKTALDGSRKAFAGTPPAAVEAARTKLKALAAVLGTIPETKTLGLRWQKLPLELRDDDQNALVAAAQRLAGTAADDAQSLLQDLRLKRQQTSRTVFDTSLLTLSTDVPATTKQLSARIEAVTDACSSLAQVVAKGVATRASKYATALLHFWEGGLKLAAHGDKCPMCEEETLTGDKRAALQARLKEAHDGLTNSREIAAATEKAKSELTLAKHVLDGASVQGLDANTRELLSKLLEKEPEALAACLEVHDALKEAEHQVGSAGAALTEFLSSIPVRLADATKAEALVVDSTTIPRAFEDKAGAFQGAMQQYSSAWVAFDQVLAKRISSNTAIGEIDAVGQALKAEQERKVVATYDGIVAKSRAIMQATEAFLQRKQVELLLSRGKDIKTLYDMLNPGAQVGFDVMEPANEQLKLHARSYGKRMSAAANLSECQLNCLGLSFWLGGATAAGSPFGFVLLDDPVQSMDDDHTEAFIGSVIPDLCDVQKKQVILLSHEKRLIERIRDLNKSRKLSVYHFDLYDISGPSITQQSTIAMMISDIKGLAKGNESNRSTAVDRLRKIGEQIVRDLHLKVLGTPLGSEYDKALPAQLLGVFRSIPGTNTSEHEGLKDTFDFASPAHHSEPGYSVPVMTNIMPHINRLENLAKAHGLFP